MEALITFLQAVAAPLSSEILLAAIAAGLFFGAFYNHFLHIPREFIYHKLIAGLGFIGFMYVFRVVSAILHGTTLASPAGWLGIALLWALFCLFIWIGDKVR